MRRYLAIAAAILCCGASNLRADFSYQQSSKVTGGAMASAMKMAGIFSKKAREPIQSSVAVKGDRMAQIDGDTAQIIDLQAETITTVNFKKKQYSVVTFEQMKQFMTQMAARAGQRQTSETEAPEVDIQVSVEETGNNSNISGMDAREFVMKMEVEGTDQQSGQSGTMLITMTTWMADPVSGYNEVQDFYKRMSGKIDWTPGSSMGALAGGGQGATPGMSQIYQESAKLEGMPVRQIVTTAFKDQGGGQQPAAASGQQQEQQEPASIGGALRGLGGLGRFGRRNKQPQEETQASPPPTQASGALMEMTIDYSAYSSAPVDPAQVDTAPAGYKQVKSDMEKALQR